MHHWQRLEERLRRPEVEATGRPGPGPLLYGSALYGKMEDDDLMESEQR